MLAIERTTPTLTIETTTTTTNASASSSSSMNRSDLPRNQLSPKTTQSQIPPAAPSSPDAGSASVGAVPALPPMPPLTPTWERTSAAASSEAGDRDRDRPDTDPNSATARSSEADQDIAGTKSHGAGSAKYRPRGTDSNDSSWTDGDDEKKLDEEGDRAVRPAVDDDDDAVSSSPNEDAAAAVAVDDEDMGWADAPPPGRGGVNHSFDPLDADDGEDEDDDPAAGEEDGGKEEVEKGRGEQYSRLAYMHGNNGRENSRARTTDGARPEEYGQRSGVGVGVVISRRKGLDVLSKALKIAANNMRRCEGSLPVERDDSYRELPPHKPRPRREDALSPTPLKALKSGPSDPFGDDADFLLAGHGGIAAATMVVMAATIADEEGVEEANVGSHGGNGVGDGGGAGAEEDEPMPLADVFDADGAGAGAGAGEQVDNDGPPVPVAAAAAADGERRHDAAGRDAGGDRNDNNNNNAATPEPPPQNRITEAEAERRRNDREREEERHRWAAVRDITASAAAASRRGATASASGRPSNLSHGDRGASAPAATATDATGNRAGVSAAGPSGGGRRSSWRSAGGDLAARRDMVRYVAALLTSRKRSSGSDPGAKWTSDLPHKARRLEERLYLSAPSLRDYLDRHTIKERLGGVAKSIAAAHQQERKRRWSSSAVDVDINAAGTQQRPSEGGGNKRTRATSDGSRRGAAARSAGGDEGGGAPLSHQTAMGAVGGDTRMDRGDGGIGGRNSLVGQYHSVQEQILHNIREQKQLLLGLGGKAGDDRSTTIGASGASISPLRAPERVVAQTGGHGYMPSPPSHMAGIMTGPPANAPPFPASNYPAYHRNADYDMPLSRQCPDPGEAAFAAPIHHRGQHQADPWGSPLMGMGASGGRSGMETGADGRYDLDDRVDSPPIAPESFDW